MAEWVLSKRGNRSAAGTERMRMQGGESCVCKREGDGLGGVLRRLLTRDAVSQRGRWCFQEGVVRRAEVPPLLCKLLVS